MYARTGTSSQWRVPGTDADHRAWHEPRVVTVLPRGPVIDARAWSSPGSGPRIPAFPTAVSGVSWVRVQLPVTVAGPRRHCTGFRIPVRVELSGESTRDAGRRQARPRVVP